MFERSAAMIALGFGVLVGGCTDERWMDSGSSLGWRLVVTRLESPPAFDPHTGSARLSVRLRVPAVPRDASVHAEFELLQGGGIPVRSLSASKGLDQPGEVELAVDWDGTDRSGRLLVSESFEALLTLELWSNDDVVATLEPTRGRQLRSCRAQEQCVIVRSCASANDDPERCAPALTESQFVCSLVGGFKPPAPLSSWSFSGTDAWPPIRLPFATSAEDRYPPNAPAGAGPTSASNPVVVATDLGSPFEHTSLDGSHEMVFLFGDTQPVPERSYEHDTQGNVFPTGSVFSQLTANDDSMATSDQAWDDPPTGPQRCLDLAFLHGGSALDPVHGIAESELIAPVTMNGPLTADPVTSTLSGIHLGFLRVPGPGFSLDGKIFALMPAENDMSIGVGCDATHPCPGGDQCLAPGACFYGDCSATDGSTPCFRRNAKATLAVRTSGTEFRSLAPSELETSPDGKTALDIYAGRAELEPSVAFFVPNPDEIDVWGRDRIVGHPNDFGTPQRSGRAELHFWKHPVTGGPGARRIGLPLVFSGCEDDPNVCDSPKFSSDPAAAVPVYDEDRLIVNQTSVAYLPNLGRWIMIYGGRLPLWTRLFYPSITEARALDPYAGVYLRTAKHPWGPWSSPVTSYNPYWSNVAGYCEIEYMSPAQSARLAEHVSQSFVDASCDASAAVQVSERPPDEFGAEYGTAIIPRFFEDQPDRASFFWVMSTWNPYRVVVMRTDLSLP